MAVKWTKTLLVDDEFHTVQKRKFFIGGACYGITYKTLEGREVYHGIGGYSFDCGKASGADFDENNYPLLAEWKQQQGI
jgi:hypothetical protein